MERLTGFLDPWADPFDSGFQLTQSLIAIGRGEWFGVGLGNSVQKLFYLPEAHTDFVFAVYAEEFGLLGSFVLIGLFALLLWRIFPAGHAAPPMRSAFRGLPRDRNRHVARPAGLHQRRREHGHPADQGPDVAARQLRPVQPDRHDDQRSASCCAFTTSSSSMRSPNRKRVARTSRRQETMSAGPILVMAGGTGGHVYPALAVAKALQAQVAGRRVAWHTHRGLESRVVPAAGIEHGMDQCPHGPAPQGPAGNDRGARAESGWALIQSLAVIARAGPLPCSAWVASSAVQAVSPPG